jgi:dipeptidyl aminopeptidase/acylaminoacyl peptidase
LTPPGAHLRPQVIPIEDAHAFAAAIRQHNLHVVDGADHNFRVPAHAEEAVKKVVAFIEGGL